MSYEAAPRRRARGGRDLSRNARPPPGELDSRLAAVPCDRIEVPQPEHYRDLSAWSARPGCGSRGWSWTTSSLQQSSSIRRSSSIRCATNDGREVGMVELDFREPGECELAFIGLVPDLAGKGHGTLAARRSRPPSLARGRRAECMSTPARSTIRRRWRPIAAPASRPTSARSSASPTRACSASSRKDCAPQVPLLGTDWPERRHGRPGA